MVSYAAPWRLVVVVTLVGTVVAASALGLRGDAPGRLLLGVVAVLLLGSALHAALLRPVLRADAHVIAVRRGARLLVVPWQDGVAVRVAASRVRLARTTWLEVDTPDALLLVHPLRLGTRPELVVRALERLRPDPENCAR